MFIFFCRVRSEDYGVMGVRYGSENLSVGASFVPIPCIYLSTSKYLFPFLFLCWWLAYPELAWD
jgi:hypothetical protein